MKKTLLVLAALLLLTSATVPAFADGNPWPHLPNTPCKSSACKAT